MSLAHQTASNDLTWRPGSPMEGPEDSPGALNESISLPEGFPTCLPGNLSWVGSNLMEPAFIHHLDDEGRLEIDRALADFKTHGLDGDLVTRENFPLPMLQRLLEALCQELHAGKGFFVLRGVDLDQYSVEDGMVIFLGIQAYIGEQRARQDDQGNMIVHIISDSTAASSPTRSLHSRHSKDSIAFHTEETGDIIAWQTRNTAVRGGKCVIASANTIYNILANTRPDIISVLARADWPFALPKFHLRPILYYHASHIILNFGRAALLGSPAHPRDPSLPTVTPQQLEALDMLEGLARATELEISTQRGDMHFIHNLSVMHRRSGFVDAEDCEVPAPEHHDHPGARGPASERKRHLVRMRLRNQHLGWHIPAELQQGWDEVFGDEGNRTWHIEPMPEAFFPLRKYYL